MADLGLGLTGTTMTKSSSNGGSRGLPGSVASHLTVRTREIPTPRHSLDHVPIPLRPQ